ncbi:hypothetical protein MTO98_33740 [Mucilaginibacter sp. SMC90]|uniref:hypothetical protein n=1 Tax=Mucilaginibacter sp. SMC90 TaxID=2929803 RepID=UPI001FB3D791|nr:hypothetical protein [Mucilaginibacter sp. SMC90]UOE49359.1 hypothetical protein MTO98_33740 [Mucilaginibacter sp. SMC90]
MTIEENRKSALRLFDENIIKYIVGDLELLDTIQPQSNGNSCAVPTAMLILGALEFIGFLIIEKGRLGNAEDNITIAIKHGNYFPATYSDSVVKTLAHTYRHGLMHSFFPQQRSDQVFGIHKSDNRKLFETFDKTGDSVISLNANVLSDDFKQYVNNLYIEIERTSDAYLLANIANAFKHRYSESLVTLSSTTTETTIAPGVTRQK